MRACLNTDLRESFKEVVADGDSVLTFASHSILTVELRQQSSSIYPASALREDTGWGWLNNREKGPRHGQGGSIRVKGRGMAKAGLVWSTSVEI